jgi:hypothetical protein
MTAQAPWKRAVARRAARVGQRGRGVVWWIMGVLAAGYFESLATKRVLLVPLAVKRGIPAVLKSRVPMK